MLNTNVFCLRLTGRQKPHQSLSILSASPQRPHYILNSQLFPQQKNEHTWHPCAEPVNGEPGRVSPETSGLTFKRAGGKPTPHPPTAKPHNRSAAGSVPMMDGDAATPGTSASSSVPPLTSFTSWRRRFFFFYFVFRERGRSSKLIAVTMETVLGSDV